MSIRVTLPAAGRNDPARTITAAFRQGPAHGRALDLDLGALGLDQAPLVIEFRAGPRITLYRRRTRPSARRHCYTPARAATTRHGHRRPPLLPSISFPRRAPTGILPVLSAPSR